jgi:hypothetical protein
MAEVEKVLLVECPECLGDGVLLDVGGGQFDTAMEQWYPDEREVECDFCGGQGSMFVEADDDV